MTIYDHTWLFITIPDQWPYLTIHIHIWPYLTIHDHTWPHMTTHDLTWPYMTINDHTRPYRMIQDDTGPHIWLIFTRTVTPLEKWPQQWYMAERNLKISSRICPAPCVLRQCTVVFAWKCRLFCLCTHGQCRVYYIYHVEFHFRFVHLITFPV